MKKILLLEERERIVDEVCDAIFKEKRDKDNEKFVVEVDGYLRMKLMLEFCSMCAVTPFVVFAPRFGMPDGLGSSWMELNKKGVEWRCIDIKSIFSMLTICLTDKDWARMKGKQKGKLRNTIAAIGEEMIADIYGFAVMSDVLGKYDDDTVEQIIEHLRCE